MTDPQRILFVDDSADELEFVRRALAQWLPEVELRCFRQGAPALEYLAGEDPHAGPDRRLDFVLLDLKLRGLGGHEILAAVRERFSAGELPVVVFSSSREPADVVEAYRMGANSYVVKPLVHEEYVDVVANVARYWLDLNVVVPTRRGRHA